MLCKNRPCVWKGSVAKWLLSKLFIWFAVFSKNIGSGGRDGLKIIHSPTSVLQCLPFQTIWFSNSLLEWMKYHCTEFRKKRLKPLTRFIKPLTCDKDTWTEVQIKIILWGFVSEKEGKLHCDSTETALSFPRSQLSPEEETSTRPPESLQSGPVGRGAR